jgi:hypothetical protein
MDARRFPSRQDAESENPRLQLSNKLLLPRGKAAFFGYFLCGGKESDPAAQRSEALGFTDANGKSSKDSLAQLVKACTSREKRRG